MKYQKFVKLQKLVECSVFIIVSTTVGEPIWSGKGRLDFSINILASFVGDLSKKLPSRE